MDKDYIAALIRRGDLGRALCVALAFMLEPGWAVGAVLRMPLGRLAHRLNLSYGRAKGLRRILVRHNLLQIVGRQEFRVLPPSAWRRLPMRAGVGIQPHNGSESSPINGLKSSPVDGVGIQAPGMESSPKGNGLESRPGAGLESRPPDPPKAVKDLKDKKTDPGTNSNVPQSAKHGSPTPSATGLSSVSTGGETGGETAPATTPGSGRLHAWSRPLARRICGHRSFSQKDAPALASSFRSLVKLHPDWPTDPDRAMASLEHLLEDLDAELHSAGELTGALRNRWAEWTAPGGSLPDIRDRLAEDGWTPKPKAPRPATPPGTPGPMVSILDKLVEQYRKADADIPEQDSGIPNADNAE
ncbi:MAG TPA: hypothetical protein VM537_32505 [Anaerolineae bacterium]|nr:hypothetical protein [Anaerolineae bacterium]